MPTPIFVELLQAICHQCNIEQCSKRRQICLSHFEIVLTNRTPALISSTQDETNSDTNKYVTQVLMGVFQGPLWPSRPSPPSLHRCQSSIYYLGPPRSVHTKDQSVAKIPRGTLSLFPRAIISAQALRPGLPVLLCAQLS